MQNFPEALAEAMFFENQIKSCIIWGMIPKSKAIIKKIVEPLAITPAIVLFYGDCERAVFRSYSAPAPLKRNPSLTATSVSSAFSGAIQLRPH